MIPWTFLHGDGDASEWKQKSLKSLKFCSQKSQNITSCIVLVEESHKTSISKNMGKYTLSLDGRNSKDMEKGHGDRKAWFIEGPFLVIYQQVHSTSPIFFLTGTKYVSLWESVQWIS